MKAYRALSSSLLALALTLPLAAAAQTAPLDPAGIPALTNGYFNAITRDDATAIAHTTSPTFHVIAADGKRLTFPDFIGLITAMYFRAQPPMGIDVKIKASNETATGATSTVDTLHWWYGGLTDDPTSAPHTERDWATHQLTWIKTSDGRWLLDEDHITAAFNT